jgi:hypothetical protein
MGNSTSEDNVLPVLSQEFYRVINLSEFSAYNNFTSYKYVSDDTGDKLHCFDSIKFSDHNLSLVDYGKNILFVDMYQIHKCTDINKREQAKQFINYIIKLSDFSNYDVKINYVKKLVDKLLSANKLSNMNIGGVYFNKVLLIFDDINQNNIKQTDINIPDIIMQYQM